MTAIALKDEQGRVWAYACSLCRHVKGGSSLLDWDDGDGPHEQLVENSLWRAERCCECHYCREKFDRRVTTFSIECAGCRRWTNFTHVWWPVSTSLQRGYTTQAEFDRFITELDDD